MFKSPKIVYNYLPKDGIENYITMREICSQLIKKIPEKQISQTVLMFPLMTSEQVNANWENSGNKRNMEFFFTTFSPKKTTKLIPWRLLKRTVTSEASTEYPLDSSI